jgi:hypothetical protein
LAVVREMFSEEVFMNECIAVLRANTYEDYEDVKVAISNYIDANLDIDIIGLEKIQELAGNIIAEYIQSDWINDANSEAATLNEDDEDVLAIHAINNDDAVMMQAIWDWINDVV